MKTARIALTALALLGGIPAAAAQDEVAGIWAGVGFQISPTGERSSWVIRLRIDAAGNGLIDYPSLECGGTLTRLAGPVAEYREQITWGQENCVDNGVVGLSVRKGKIL